jgi:hypothetical protein
MTIDLSTYVIGDIGECHVERLSLCIDWQGHMILNTWNITDINTFSFWEESKYTSDPVLHLEMMTSLFLNGVPDRRCISILSSIVSGAYKIVRDGQCRPSSDVIAEAAARVTATDFLTHTKIPICWVPQWKGELEP